jgi:hypothetical protein
MKNLLLTGLALGVMAVFTGCSEKAVVEKKETVSTPQGETTTTETHKVESSGENPPVNSQGEKAK